MRAVVLLGLLAGATAFSGPSPVGERNLDNILRMHTLAFRIVASAVLTHRVENCASSARVSAQRRSVLWRRAFSAREQDLLLE